MRYGGRVKEQLARARLMAPWWERAAAFFRAFFQRRPRCSLCERYVAGYSASVRDLFHETHRWVERVDRLTAGLVNQDEFQRGLAEQCKRRI